tara:strand:- start:1260 stop:1484 length:225 start_codon:yes stop_codon:yes gene_type:complete
MGEKKTTPISINDTEYVLEDMNEQHQAMVKHVADLDRKISSTRFNLDQLSVGRQAFMNMLTQQLAVDEVAEEAS